MGTAIGLSPVAAILVGLPLLAVLAGRRLPLLPVAKTPEDLGLWLKRSLGVTGQDHVLIEDAVRRGHQVEPRLRPAAAAYARRLERQLQDQQASLRRHRWLFRGFLVVLVAGVTSVAFVKSDGILIWDVCYLIVYPLLIVLARRRTLQRVRRAVEVNSEAGPVTGGDGCT